MNDQPVVLVVEDEPDVAETYKLWLRDDHDVRVAHDGERALELVDDDVDVVLLDRMMPGLSGDEVLVEMRERELDVQVAMVTAVDPDFDIIEMGFDDYVTKPPTREGLHETVSELLAREAHADGVREYHALLSKRAALEDEKSPADLEASDDFERLESDIDEMETKLEAGSDRLLDDAAFVSELRDLTGEGNGREGADHEGDDRPEGDR
jgi:two-component system response regulator AdeR